MANLSVTCEKLKHHQLMMPQNSKRKFKATPPTSRGQKNKTEKPPDLKFFICHRLKMIRKFEQFKMKKNFDFRNEREY